MVSIEEFDEANRRGEERRNAPKIVSGRYDRSTARVVLKLSTGIYLAVPHRIVQGLETASAEELAAIEISPSGLGVHFPKLDADIYLPALLEGTTGSKKWSAVRLGALGGSAKSAAKAKASRSNGIHGGRPRKPVTENITAI